MLPGKTAYHEEKNMRITLLSILLIGSVYATPDESNELVAATNTLIDFSLQLQDNPHRDSQVWQTLFAPVCAALYDTDQFAPRTTAPLFSPAQQRAYDLLQAYIAHQKSIPASVHAACQTLERHCLHTRRGPGRGNRTFHADAAGRQAARSSRVQQARRYTSAEHKKQEGFRKERLAQQRAENLLANYHTEQAKRAASHAKKAVNRANRQYSEWSKQACEKMRDKQRKTLECDRVRAEHSATVNRVAAEEARKLKQAAENLLK